MSLRIGVLGTGRMATEFARDLADEAELTVTVVGSRDLARARAFSARWSIPHACAGYEALAGRADVDLVYVATPHTAHCENTLLCLQAGKHVLCEKPFSLNAAEAERMIDLARTQNLFLMEAMWTRFLPSVVRLRELLADGAIGPVQMMIAGGAFVPDDESHYLFDPHRGGGVLLDAGVYLVSLASHFLGEPRGIAAQGVIGEHGVDEQTAVLLRHADDALATLYVSLRARQAPALTLLGAEGTLSMDPPVFCPRGLTLTRHGEPSQSLTFDFTGGYRYQVRAVADCLRKGLTEHPAMPLDETLQIMRTLDEIRRLMGLQYPGEEVTCPSV